MNIQIITSSYPEYAGDPSGAAGLFVRDFSLALMELGHTVIIQPVARKTSYEVDPGLLIEPLPWRGGDRELASMPLYNPIHWFTFARFFLTGCNASLSCHRKYQIDRTFCLWIIPSGIFGWFIHRKTRSPYDLWALGSDIWKIRKIPILGNKLLKWVIGDCHALYADGVELSQDIESITGRPCAFLPSSRRLPPPRSRLHSLEPANKTHFLFVGRYHPNKGPDLLIDAIEHLAPDIRNQAHFHIYGLGPMEKELAARLKLKPISEATTFNGPIHAQDLSDMLHLCHFLIISSRIESIPVVFSDSLQSGTPVISTPVGDLPDLISSHQCGILSEAVSGSALAAAITRAIEKGTGTFADGVQSAARLFDIREIARKWTSTYGTGTDSQVGFGEA